MWYLAYFYKTIDTNNIFKLTNFMEYLNNIDFIFMSNSLFKLMVS